MCDTGATVRHVVWGKCECVREGDSVSVNVTSECECDSVRVGG